MKRVFLFWCLGTTALFAQSTAMGSRTMEGDWDASGAKTTKPAKTGTVLPASCSSGEAFFKTDVAGGQNLYLCKPDNTWTQVSGGVSSVFGRSGSIVAQPGDYTFLQIGGTISSGQLPVAGGDLSGGLVSATVTGIQSRPVGTAAPAAGNVLTWSGSQWAPGAAGGVTHEYLVFDGSTTNPGDGSTISWSCGSGSGATCTANWTVPAGVTSVKVQAWSAGGAGGGATAGGYSNWGGGGGGFYEMTCPTTPGNSVTVTVGLGGVHDAGGGNGLDGGNSGFGGCFSVIGGQYSNGAAWGYLAGVNPGTYGTGWNQTMYCTGTISGQIGPSAFRADEGGCGGGINYTDPSPGGAGGSAALGGGGGGGGAYDSNTYGAGGTSGYGGGGGHGGAWTSGSGLVACADGSIPGGGGGAGGVATAGNGNGIGCNGDRGEVRVYYVK